ncbi:MAG: DUF3617 domain-containing protein [Methylobacillus sp.]|nr:DUF3617 domain-containing protein [Methylobacillus sp.]
MKQVIVLAAALLLVACEANRDQSAADLPVNMGLWEATVVSKEGKFSLVSQVCITPDTWQKTLVGEEKGKCQKSNLKHDVSGLSADIECASEGGKHFSGRWQLAFVSREKMHVTGPIELDQGSGQPPKFVAMEADSVYLGADCKDVKPNSPKLVRFNGVDMKP